MKKLYAFALAAALTPAIAMADAMDDQYFNNYAHVTGTVGTQYSARGVKTLLVEDNAGNSVTVQGTGQTSHDVYADRTETAILTVNPGAIITVTGTPEAENGNIWTHSYLYIDFGQDGRFDVDMDNLDANNDLVVHNGYSLTSNNKYGSNADTADPTQGSSMLDGTKFAVTNTDTYSLHAFQLPEDMQPGTYRVRFKNDWNSTHPYGRTNNTKHGAQKDNNGIIEAGGVILDFTLVVEGEVSEDKTHTFQFNDECEFVEIYGDAELTKLLGSSETNDSDMFEIKESDMEDGLWFVFSADESLELKEFTVNYEEMQDQVEGNIFHVALADLPTLPEDYVTLYGWAEYIIYVEYKAKLAGIEEVGVDFNAADVEYFNLQGVKVAADNLNSGVYVARQGDKAVKVLIKK